MTTINPYLTFDGNCEEAFNYYKEVFGGEFTFIGKFKDMPPHPGFIVMEEEKEKIMHVTLPISKETHLMGSDSSKAFGIASNPGNNIALSVNTTSTEKADTIFAALSKNGIIKMPLSKTFWGSYFGQCTDQFGIHWQVNCELEAHKEFEATHKK